MNIILKMDIHIFSVLLCGFVLVNLIQAKEETVCLGSDQGLTHSSGSNQRYPNYEHIYTNCTFVDGNLEIVFLDDEDNYDLSFLSNIKEVTGYVLISNVFADYVPLTSLRIIRGRTLFKSNDGKYYSLYVSLNYKPGHPEVGLKELRFTKLYEILRGDVLFYNNNLLCYENTIEWSDILTNEGQQRPYFHSDSQKTKQLCGQCHVNCTFKSTGKRHCWGSEPDMCQKLSKNHCVPQCGGRCFGKKQNQCCNSECVGGCTGPTNKDCWACKNFNNDGVCVPFCPKESIYDPEEFKYVPNKNAKYTYGTLCVNKCPEHLVVDSGACVRDCGAGHIANDITKKCERCEGVCPKQCPGTDSFKSEFIDSQNIGNFTGCTIISGNIRILANTFSGDEHHNVAPMHPRELSALKTVKAINGHLMIQGQHPDFTSLEFFENLEKIHGRKLDSVGSSFHIYDTTLKSLDLMQLSSIENGHILIKENTELCYATTINWHRLFNDAHRRIFIGKNKSNKTCSAEGFTCNSQCSADGCWGGGDDHCLSCENYILNGRCLESCDPALGMYISGPKTCMLCHEECADTCTGSGADECDNKCRNFQDGPYCVTQCPENKYPDNRNICQSCHENCREGCTGPMNTLGDNACNLCQRVILDEYENVIQCDNKPEADCDSGFFRHKYDLWNKTITIESCAKCHKFCKQCWGSAASMCDECIYFEEEKRCVENCSRGYYPADNNCRICDSRCVQCYGHTNSECLVCKQYKVYTDPTDQDHKPRFNCTDKCPEWAPYKTPEENPETGEVENVCTPKAYVDEVKGFVNQKNLPVLIGSGIAGVIVFGLIFIIVAVYCQKRAKALESKERLAARMSGLCEESEFTPLTPTDAKPDMATLRLIKESELRKGTMVGSGAFGTVYKGFWIPDGENVKIPVAIKVLQEGTSSSQNHELLEEARVMASVDNKYCVPILGVCMTAQMMLITPYMPLGCLLDYVRKNKDNIGSKVLLDWCTQIAMGMSYLEERGIVHRDLAARNVLVQNPKRVRVTDFGLSKLLDVDEPSFHATGGKMPIKWLALECMQHRVFTHKSDVWSFGVAIWELFTYGSRPYENIRARDIPELLEKGERLPQPAICTIDVYMIMIKCWMLDAQSRPAFKELAEEFSKMARDPGRYLVIQGDRLMRLPSHSTETKRDMFRNMSVSVDGPEEIVEAEEYLMPGHGDEAPSPVDTVYRPRQYRSNGKLEKVREENSGGSNYDNERTRSNRSEPPCTLDQIIQPPSSPGGRHSKYSGLEAAAAMRKQREAEPNRDSVKTRYSSDPCKVLGPPLLNGLTETEGMGDDYLPPAPPTPIANPHAQSPGNVFFGDDDDKIKAERAALRRLPVDEDDYLQPQSANFGPKYLDMVQDNDYLPPNPSHPQDPYSQPGHQPSYPQSYGMDMDLIAQNPEYFDTPGDSDQVNLSIDRSQGSERQPLTASYNKNNFRDQPLRSRSIETESDGANSEHDYYNETDLLSKKKNPSRFHNTRTESVV